MKLKTSREKRAEESNESQAKLEVGSLRCPLHEPSARASRPRWTTKRFESETLSCFDSARESPFANSPESKATLSESNTSASFPDSTSGN